MSSSKPPNSPPDSHYAYDDDLPPSYTPYEDAVEYAVPGPSNNQRSVTQQQQEGPGAQPPPAYTRTETYGSLDISEGGMNTKAQLSGDGRVNININQKSRHMASVISPSLRRAWQLNEVDTTIQPSSYAVPEFAIDTPPLNILIQIIGSRGDVQPFIALGKVLKRRYKHRVRVATHPTFKSFVEEHGLEFFSVGGDPSELMAFMVKNPGLVPGIDSLKAGDVTKRRKDMWEMLLGGWRACIEPGDGMGSQNGRPFVADAIIANPPSFGHIHCAERLGIPLHLMFTMPWSPTAEFPHPLANILSSDVEGDLTNFLSYVLVDMMTWQGLGDLVNKFREKTLGLESISTLWAPGMISQLKIPHTYCWSPTLIPKPHDWPAHLNVSGFFFLDLADNYVPPPDLDRFLTSGPAPVYIGFGSIVVADPDALTRKIFEAVRLVGCRALVSKGWGGLGASDLEVPENIMLLGNCPHDWLFPRCSAVVHHGGAGTTAAGIRCGIPTVIVPFFGDQPFWGKMIAAAGAGPEPIPNAELTAENLAAAIQRALSREVQARAEVMGESIKQETGCDEGAKSFLRSLGPMGLARCDILHDRPAVWSVRGSDKKLSALAASALVEAKLIEGGFGGLKLWRHKEWVLDDGPLEPITGGAGALIGTIGSIMLGVGDFPKELFKSFATAKGKEPAEGQAAGQAGQAGQSTESLATTRSVGDPEGAKSPTDKGKKFDLAGAIGASSSVSKIVGAGIRSPMDFTLGLAQGFHNAPKLYGDKVHPTPNVTGFHSGLKAAGIGFGRGLYDGITGLVTQPLEGAKNEGASGAIKGFGKGIGGLVLKSGAGVWGLPGYTMKGIHREILKLGTKDLKGYIETARAAQGLHELREAEELRPYIIHRWSEIKSSSSSSPSSFKTDKKRPSVVNHDMRSYEDPQDTKSPLSHNIPNSPPGYDENEAYERAIRASLSEAPCLRNDDHDADYQRALRASVNLSQIPQTHDEEYQKAVKASLDEANRGEARRSLEASRAVSRDGPPGPRNPAPAVVSAAGSLDPDLAAAIRASMLDYTPPTCLSSPPTPLPYGNLGSLGSPISPSGGSQRPRSFDIPRKPVPVASPPPLPQRHTGLGDGEDREVLEVLHLRHPEDEPGHPDYQGGYQERSGFQGDDKESFGNGYTNNEDRELQRVIRESKEDEELARAVRESLRIEEEEKRKRDERERAVIEYVMEQSREEEKFRR